MSAYKSEESENRLKSHLNLDLSEQRLNRRRVVWERILYFLIFTVGLFALLSLVVYTFVYRAPRDFPVGTVVHIEEGMTLQEIAHDLEAKSVVRSRLALRALVEVFGSGRGVVAGDYFFKEQQGLQSVAHRILYGEYGLDPITVTIPEGITVTEMASIYEKKLPEFDAVLFVGEALPHEGYLFPDTYHFLPTVRVEAVVKVMRENFDRQVATIEEEIELLGRPLEEIVIMASLLEKEASETEVRQMIAGILWRRIELDMLLQVDAVFPYIIGKNTFEVTMDDLQYDSPYNTYKYKGLPAGPIANPGIDSLRAAVTPIESDFLFYLADMEGVTHYARTFEEHQQNVNRYLR